jgi:hypothetical protein
MDLAFSIGFDLVAIVLTTGYIAKLVIEEFLSPSVRVASAGVVEPSIAKRSLLSQHILRRVR